MAFKVNKKREAFDRGKTFGNRELFEMKKFRQRVSKQFETPEEKMAFKRGFNKGVSLKKI